MGSGEVGVEDEENAVGVRGGRRQDAKTAGSAGHHAPLGPRASNPQPDAGPNNNNNKGAETGKKAKPMLNGLATKTTATGMKRKMDKTGGEFCLMKE